MTYHQPVMPEEVVTHLVTDANGIYCDGTLGGGGHTQRILKALGLQGHIHGIDRDAEAIEHCKRLFAGEKRVTLHRGNFSGMREVLGEITLSGILLDLGVSSHQLDSPDRGFSFVREGPLDLRMDAGEESTALHVIQTYEEAELARCFRLNADITYGRRLAAFLKGNVDKNSNTGLIHRALDALFPKGLRHRNRELARIFQALRMEVNREQEAVKKILAEAPGLLKQGGRLCVISFHSIEDRWVKKTLAAYERSCICPPKSPVCVCGGNHQVFRRVVRKPVIAGEEEIRQNPRARSAKLRVVEKTR